MSKKIEHILPKKIRLYLCTTSFEEELGRNEVPVYRNFEELKKEQKCFKKCGVVEFEAIPVKYKIKPNDPYLRIKGVK